MLRGGAVDYRSFTVRVACRVGVQPSKRSSQVPACPSPLSSLGRTDAGLLTMGQSRSDLRTKRTAWIPGLD